MKSSSFRAFIAIDLPKKTKREIARLLISLREKDKTTRWITPDKLHITLKFLGNISLAESAQIIKIIKPIINSHQTFEIEFKRFCYLPSRKNAHIIALAPTPITPLTALAAKIGKALAARNFASEQRKFKPHLTIGKTKEPTVLPSLKPKRIKFKARKVVLFQSKLLKTGSIYTPMKSFL